jgi:hypothetical protein
MMKPNDEDGEDEALRKMMRPMKREKNMKL